MISYLKPRNLSAEAADVLGWGDNGGAVVGETGG